MPDASPLDSKPSARFRRYSRKRKRLYYSDIAEKLRLDFSTVIRACEVLKKKGLIQGR